MTIVRVSIARASCGPGEAVSPRDHDGKFATFWLDVREKSRPPCFARLQWRVSKRFRMISLATTGARVVERTLFFAERPANARFHKSDAR